MADYRVTVGVFIEDESLENLKSQIKGLKTEKVKVTADTESVKKKLATVNKLLKNFKTPNKINLTISTKPVLNKISTVQKALNKLKKTKITLDVGNSTKNTKNKQTPANQNVTPKNNTAGLEKDLRRIKNVYKEISNLTSKKMKLNGLVNTAEIAEMEAQLERARTKVMSLRSSLETKMGASNFATAMGDDFEKAINKIALAEAKVDDAKQKAYAKISTSYSGSANLSKMFDIDNKVGKLSTVNQTTTASVERLRAAYANLGTALQSGNVEHAIAAQKRFEDALEETNYAIKKNQALNKNAMAAQSLDIGKQKLGNDIDMWFKNNSAAAREFGAQIESLKTRLKTCDSVELSNLRSEFNKLKTDAQMAGKTGKSFADNMKSQFSKLGTYMAASMGIMEAIMLMRNMFDNVLKVDTALTELYRVTDLTSSGYSNLYDSMSASAKEYGVVLSDLISSTAAWARLGFDANVANEMAEISAMYQHIADLDYDTAVENLVTGFKGFEDQLQVKFGDDDAAAMEYIADIYNEIGNNFAIGSDQVGDSLTRAASALSIAGNTIEESAGMVTAVTEVTQDPEKAGSAMKILSLRLRGMKGELEDMGEPIDDNVEDISKMQQQVYQMTGEKVNIFDDMGNFKSTYDIMQEIAAVWDDLNSVQQADLLETIAGKNRANDVAALINNWEQAEAAAGAAENASGSASREHLKYMDSLEGRINTFKASWQVFSNTLVDSDFLKGAVSGATSLLNVLDGIVNTLGLLPTLIGAAAGGFAMFKSFQRNKNGEMGMGFNLKKDQFGNNVGMQFGKTGAKQFIANNSLSKSYNAGYSQGFKFDPSFQKQVDADRAALTRLNDALKQTKSGVMSFKEVETHMAGASKQAVEYAKYNQQNLLDQNNLKKLDMEDRKAAVATSAQDKSLKNVGRLMKEYNTQCKTVGMSQAQFATQVGQGNSVLGKYMASLNGAKGSMGGYIASLVSTKAASVALQGATMALNGVLSMGAGILATLVMSAAISGIMKLINAEEDLANKVADATAKYNDQKKALGDTGNFESLAQRYKELSAGVTGTGMNMSLNTAEYEEYKQVVSELAELMPELVSGYNAEGVAILNCAGSYEQLQKAREDAIVANSRELKEGAQDIFDDFAHAEADMQSTGMWGNKFNLDAADEVDKYFKGEYESIDEAISNWDSATEGRILKAFEDSGIELDENASTSEQLKQALQEEPEKCRQVAEEFFADLEAELASMKSLADAHISEMFASSTSGFDFSEDMQSAINSVVGSLGYDFYNQFNSPEELYGGLNEMLTNFGEMNQELLPNSLDMLSDFNAGDIGIGEYYDQISQVTEATKNWDEATKQAVQDMLNADQVTETYENLVRDIESLGELDMGEFASIEEYVDQLSGTEAAALIQVIPEFRGDSLEDLSDALRGHTLLTPVDIDITSESEGLEKLNTALAESASASGLSAESIAALETRYASLEAKGYDLSQLFENTAHGVHLNAEAYSELEEAYNLENMEEMTQKITDLKDRHAELTEQLERDKQAGKDTSGIEVEISQVEQLLAETERLQSQYEGLTSAYGKWQAAAEAGNERDMYTNVGTGLQELKDTLEDGWLGTADKRLLELVTGQDLLTASAADCVKAYKGLDKAINSAGYSVNDFFTYDDEGNATATGIKQFWETVNAAEDEIGKNIVKKKDGNIIGFDIQVEDKEAIAKALGVSEELVDIFIKASADAGFTIDMNGNMTALSELRETAEDAYKSLKKMNKDTFEFNFSATSGEELTKNLTEAKALLKDESFYVDGKFNMDAKGAKEAFEIASYFQSIQDQNTYSAYLKMDTTSASEELKKPLEQVQDFADLTMQKHQLELTGGDTSEIDKQIESVAANLHKIDNAEVKAQLGIEGMTEEEIMSALESGEVKVPGTVDFEANMSSSMEKIADYISVLTGQMTQEEFNLKYPVNVEPEGEVKDENLDKVKEEAKNKVEEVEAELEEIEAKPLDVDIDIEATAENISTIDESINAVKTSMQEINNSDVEANVKCAQLDDAKAKLELLISKKIEASQPTFMSLDSSKVDSSLTDALAKVQAYQSALNEVNRLTQISEAYKGAGIEVDTGQLDAAKKKAEECLAAVQGLDGDVKVAIGLEENGDADSILQSFESNSVKFSVDTQGATTEVEQIAASVQELEDKDVLIKANVEGLDEVKELSSNVQLVTSIEGSVASMTEFVEDAKALSELDSAITTEVRANVSGNVLDTAEIKLNNLEVFANSAKGLKDVGSTTSKVTANVEGNIISTPEYMINNIKTFVESAKGVESIGSDTQAKITASVHGNVIDTAELKLNNIKTFIESAKGISSIGENTTANITANANGNVFERMEFSINNLKTFIDSAKGIENLGDGMTASITANVHGNVFTTMETTINNLDEFIRSAEGVEAIGDDTQANITANAKGNVFSKMEFNIDNLQKFISCAKGVKNIGENTKANITANANGNVFERMEFSIDNLKTFIESAKGIEALDGGVNATVVANANGTVFERMEFSINNLKTFIESAKGIQDLDGGVNATVVANANGNVFERMEFSINNLKTFIESAKGIEALDGGVNATIVANADGNVFERMEFSINNLKTFIESANGIKDLNGGASVDIVANADGNVFERMEFSINNLKTFIESADGIKNIGPNAEANVTANADGNVFERMEFSINNLKTFISSAQGIKNFSGEPIKAKIVADVDGNVFERMEFSIDNLKKFVDSAQGIKNFSGEPIKSKIVADVDGNVFETMEVTIDNLSKYISSAKGIKNFSGDTIESKIVADIDGNVFTTMEGTIDNLKVFIDSAKGVKNIGPDTQAKVTANLKGNVPNKSEETIKKLVSFANSAKKLSGVKTKKVTITAAIKGKLSDDKIDKLARFKDAATNLPKSRTITVTVDANTEKIDKVKSSLQSLADSGVMKNYSANVNVVVSGKDAIVTVKNAISKIVSKTVNVVASVSGTSLVTALKNAISKLKGKKVNVTAKVSGTSSVNSLKSAINGLSSKSVKITASVSGYQSIVNLKTKWDGIKSKTVTITTKKKGGSGDESPAAGTAYASGTSGNAFARGNWGIKGNGIALGGELGPEIVVRNGRFFTIGDNGAEFFRYQKNDIVFNAAQTESLFKYGGIKGAKPRGTMLATGSAFAGGTIPSSGKAFVINATGGFYSDIFESSTPSTYITTTTTTTTGTKGKKGKTTSSTDDKKFKEVFDWVEIKIERVEKALEKLNNTAENTFKNWINRNNALNKSITQTRSEIQTLRSAYNRYMQEARSITFSKWDKNKKKWVYDSAYDKQMKENLREGKIDISTITNENRSKKMQEYLDWWNKAQDVLDKIDQASQELAEKYVQKFDNVITQYEGKLARFEHSIAMIEEQISQAEAKGQNVSTAYYKQLQNEEKKRQTQLKAEKKRLLTELESAVRSGAVQYGSEEWQRMVNEIDAVDEQIAESETAWLEYEQTIRELKWESFDTLMDKIEGITKETEFLIDLLGNEKLYNEDTGELTDAGRATMGMHAQNYNVHMEQAAQYQKEIDAMGEIDPLDQEAIDRRNELIEAQRDSILAAQDEKQAIRDMVEEGIQYELDAMQERIDKYNEALQSEKDLYDYQKKVKEQTKQIADIEKQMAAYAGDDSEEARQRMQKLQVQLEDAKAELEETEYDQYMSGQEELLDDLYTEYEELLNARLDNLDELVSDVINEVNSGASDIQKTIESAASSVGYQVSQAVMNTWTGNGNATSTYGGGTADSANNTAGSVSNVAADHAANDVTNPDGAAYQSAQNDAASTTTAADSPQATNAKQGDGIPQVNDMVTLKKGTGVYSTATGKTSKGKSSKKKTTTKENKGLFITQIAKDAKGKLKAFPYRLSYRRDRATGDFGWVRRYAIGKNGKRTRENFTGYATGAEKILQDQIAWTQEKGREFIVRPSDGAILTPLKKGDSVLNAHATGNIWDMANDPAEFIKENLSVDSDSTPIVQATCATYTQNLEKVVFSFPDVKNYDEMLAMMQRDQNFERLLLSMTFDQIVGKSALGKGKSIR